MNTVIWRLDDQRSSTRRPIKDQNSTTYERATTNMVNELV